MDAHHQSAVDAAGISGRSALVLNAGGAGIALAVDVSQDEMLDVWAVARAAVDQTKRWPLLCAWRLAFEHHVLAEATFRIPDVPLRQHARLLPRLDRWVLFSRP